MAGRGVKDRPDVRVWDPVVRVGHWLLVTCVVLAWFTRHGGGSWHEVIGYLSLAVVGVRLLWGAFGSPHARFMDFLKGPRQTLVYAREMWRGTEPRHLGHNPLGGYMIVALVTMLVVVGGSGWLYTTDRFWGIAWVEAVHLWSTYALFALVALHVGGVLYASLKHRENLVAAMIHGRKRGADDAAADAADTAVDGRLGDEVPRV